MMGLLEENGVIAIKEMFQEVRVMYSRAFFRAARQMTVLKRQFSCFLFNSGDRRRSGHSLNIIQWFETFFRQQICGGLSPFGHGDTRW
jgi:hypothetical protein